MSREIIIIFWSILTLSTCYIETGTCRLNRLNSNKSSNGIVEKKEHNVKRANNSEILYFNSGTRYVWSDQNYEYNQREFYHLIYVGDSIVKEKGSLEMYVYRSDTSFVIDLSFPCDN